MIDRVVHLKVEHDTGRWPAPFSTHTLPGVKSQLWDPVWEEERTEKKEQKSSSLPVKGRIPFLGTRLRLRVRVCIPEDSMIRNPSVFAVTGLIRGQRWLTQPSSGHSDGATRGANLLMWWLPALFRSFRTPRVKFQVQSVTMATGSLALSIRIGAGFVSC
jgi:hypothetical protein